MSDHALLLEVVRDASARGNDVSAALRTCGLPRMSAVADRLDAGQTLPQALAGILPARLATLLVGGIPPLTTVAAILADEEWRRGERRRLVINLVAYPLASLATVGIIALCLLRFAPAGPWYGTLVAMRWAFVPAALAMLIVLAPWLPRILHMPGSGWSRHLDAASRWARAGLSAHWRLTEDQAVRLLGVDLQPMATILGSPGASDHCRMLAEWHRRAAHRSLLATAFLAASLVLATGGGVVLGSARMWLQQTPVESRLDRATTVHEGQDSPRGR
jgi:hypothetical protein